MKGIIRVVTTIVLALVYCFGVSSIYNHSAQLSNDAQHTESIIYSASVNLLGSPSNAENIVVSFNNSFSADIKSSFRNYIIKIKTTQQVFAKEFLQYTFFVTNFQILFQKTDLIFPFNYFW
ncbi:MAG: hypothetical protein AB7O47_09415 [Flavobacteriales bacterium]